ncbi:MAG: 30S ribosomal protein S6--L-glutamate ligase, partial [Rhodanobacteraceae bacterium]
LGLGIAGVDLLRSERGPLVLEVNASPGLEGIETVTGVDVADAVIRHVEAAVGGTSRPRRDV